jgi:hypothetical protein
MMYRVMHGMMHRLMMHRTMPVMYRMVHGMMYLRVRKTAQTDK